MRLPGRKAALLLLLLAAALPLAGCGKRGIPAPPPGTADAYPRAYPHE